MNTIQIPDPNIAAALLAYGIQLIEVKKEPSILFIFQETIDTKNIITLYQKQYAFCKELIRKEASRIKLTKQDENTPFGGLKMVYKESTRKIKGAPQKANGTWKA